MVFANKDPPVSVTEFFEGDWALAVKPTLRNNIQCESETYRFGGLVSD